MDEKSATYRTDILSVDEEEVLCVLREIAAGLRDRGVVLGLAAFEAAVLAAGAARADPPAGTELRAFGLGGVRFTARAAEPAAEGVEICFLSDWR
jgi:hypothetical protein